MGFFDFLSGVFPKKKKTAKKKTGTKRTPKAKGKKIKAGGRTIDADQLAEDLETIRNDDEKRKKKKKKKAKPQPPLKKASAKSPKKKKTRQAPTDVESVFKLKKTKGKKKAKQVTAEPIDESALGFSVELDKDSEGAKKRKAFRISVKGLKVRCPKLGGILEATDISASGIGFKFEKPRIKGGVVLKLDIVYKKEIKAEKVECKVMRHEKGLVGCQFVNMDRHQDDAVHALVVIGQKEQADRRRKQKDQNWKPPS